ncbi:hypothetical protein X945_3215 [Burkholderia pseudomallei ABCPW 107]|uniref:hypothetical protein n=1 Tax=Burkholderia pseudomallei TaxID=28450 RepID=UPI000531158A|nr:hypothetical protein [Burkholderia pseudomallei]KGS43821.1 hypothetical protein X945_3215 [Burkholderia pseudomallei ABCPW 107]
MSEQKKIHAVAAPEQICAIGALASLGEAMGNDVIAKHARDFLAACEKSTMNDQQQNRADALTEAQIRAFAEGACEYEIGLGAFRQNVATVGNVILAIRNALNLAAASPVEQPALLTAQDALAAIETFEIVGDNNDSREPNAEDRFILTEFVAHLFGGFRVELPAAAPASANETGAEGPAIKLLRKFMEYRDSDYVPNVLFDRARTIIDNAMAAVAPADERAAGMPDEVRDSMMDSQYLAGVTAGWNAANADDPNAALKKIHDAYSGYLNPLRDWQKAGRPGAPATPATADERAECIAWANANGFPKYHESMCAAWEERARRAAASTAPADEPAVSFEAWCDRFPEISAVERLRDAWQEARAAASPADEHSTIECQAHSGPDCTECSGTGAWSGSADERAACTHQWTWADGKCADCGASTKQPTPTGGMTLGERIAHVGGRVTEDGTVEFGSVMALDALVQHVLRDTRAAASPAAAIPAAVLNALRFYANGHHFNIDNDHQQFDTVSGEPQNWLCSERDGDCTMIEDGSIAKTALCGGVLGFEEPEKPVEGEVFTPAPQPAHAEAASPAAEAVPDDCDVRKILLNVVPGMDGEGHEVYARNVADVEQLLSEMGERLDAFESTPQPAQADAPAEARAKSISDEMMDLADRLGSEWKDVDPRAWQHLLVYAPAEAFPYQKTFNAIAAATSVEGGHVSISVKAFRDAFGGAVAEAREPIAWVTDDDRAITAAQKQRALADGGATASSVRPYSIPCYAVSAPADAGEARLTDAARDMLAERRRQVEAEGWTPEHDDQYQHGAIALAAACYAANAGGVAWADPLPSFWPWMHNWWKPTTPRRDLVKAGALILAELERLDRAALLNGADHDR